MFRIISRSALYALPLSLILSCLTTYLLYQDNNNNEVYTPYAGVIDYNYLFLEFSLTFTLSFALQVALFVSINFLMKLFPDR